MPADYDDDTIAACHSVLLEALTVLGKQREHLVVVGGWAPALLYGAGGHVGSIDVDLALDGRRLPNYVYETVAKDLAARSYYRQEGDPPNRFRRDVTSGSQTFTIRVDLITGVESPDATSSHRVLQGLPVWCARGVEVALDHWTEVKVSGTLPGGGNNTVAVRVATAAALVVMKGIALEERMKEKDAYDIYYCLRHHPAGVAGLAGELRALAHDATVQAALRSIGQKFDTIDSVGPVWAAQVTAQSGGDYEQARRDAFERAAALLDIVAIPGRTQPQPEKQQNRDNE
jgi:hypothetical protein